MLRISIQFLSGSKAGTVEVFPTSRYENLYLGRDPGCDVRFHPEADPMVSRNHAVLEWRRLEGTDGYRVLVSDLLSSNGTYLNDRRVSEPTPLYSGDRLTLGRGGPEVALSFDEETRTAEAPAPAPVRSTQEMPRADLQETIRREISKRKW